MLSTLRKIFSRSHIEISFLIFPENRICPFLQIVNLHETSNPVLWEKQQEKNITNSVSSAELAKSVVKVNKTQSTHIMRFVSTRGSVHVVQ